MSPDNYEKILLAGVKGSYDALIDIGVTPYVFCEGKYNRRLDIISDVPKEKLIYMFEEVDIAEAKRIDRTNRLHLRKICLMRCWHMEKKSRVIEETKKNYLISVHLGAVLSWIAPSF